MMLWAEPYSTFEISPEYIKAYERGYNAGRNEMLEFLKGMQAIKNSTETISLVYREPRRELKCVRVKTKQQEEIKV